MNMIKASLPPEKASSAGSLIRGRNRAAMYLAARDENHGKTIVTIHHDSGERPEH
ncbi:MAG: hypothetical protein KJ990_11275 [Proteobacteria bacterium]|nr:hypothetical protein [Pseudomonadota bacterium]MBU1647836.1 hypothetical protein [Pseudomonadota bacterium]